MISIKNQMQKKPSVTIIFTVLAFMPLLIISIWKFQIFKKNTQQTSENYSILTSILPIIILLLIVDYTLTLLLTKKRKPKIFKNYAAYLMLIPMRYLYLLRKEKMLWKTIMQKKITCSSAEMIKLMHLLFHN